MLRGPFPIPTSHSRGEDPLLSTGLVVSLMHKCLLRRNLEYNGRMPCLRIDVLFQACAIRQQRRKECPPLGNRASCSPSNGTAQGSYLCKSAASKGQKVGEGGSHSGQVTCLGCHRALRSEEWQCRTGGNWETSTNHTF